MKKVLLSLLLSILILSSYGQSNIFTSQIPTATSVTVDAPVTLGMKFRSTLTGNIVGVRFYKVPGMTGTHTGLLYNSSGTLLGSIVFTGETTSGWQTANFGTSVAISANTTYIIAYYNALGAYLHDGGYFATSALTNGVLTALKEGTDGSNGVYTYGGSPAFPTSTFSSNNYWVDVIFSATGLNANAGPNQNIVVPASSVTLDGTASTGTITTYAWTKLSGPNTPTIVSASSATTSVTGLIAGVYVFQLSLNSGASTSTVTITVSAALPPNVISTTLMTSAGGDSLRRPNAGGQHWGNTDWDNINSPDLPPGNSIPMNYFNRFNWQDVQTTRGVYDFTAFDNYVHKAIDKGAMFSFGMMAFCSACGSAGTIPSFVQTDMTSEGKAGWSNGGFIIPNYQSNSWSVDYNLMLHAIANHIAATSYSGHTYTSAFLGFDMRFYGDFGEGNGFSTGTCPSGAQVTDAYYINQTDSSRAIFPNVQLTVPMSYEAPNNNYSNSAGYPSPQAAYYMLTTTNSYGRIGWRRDNIGDDGYNAYITGTTATYLGNSLLTLLMNCYKVAPVGGEPSSVLVDVSRCGTAYCDVHNEDTLFHMDYFGNGNYPVTSGSGADWTNTVTHMTAANAEEGYRLVIDSGGISSVLIPGQTFTLSLLWKNKGLAPVYEPWNVVIDIRKPDSTTVVASYTSSFNPALFLPSTSDLTVSDIFTLPSNIPLGANYQLYVTIKDPAAYKVPLPLAIYGRRSDGSYLLSGNIVVGVQSCNCSSGYRGARKVFSK